MEWGKKKCPASEEAGSGAMDPKRGKGPRGIFLKHYFTSWTQAGTSLITTPKKGITRK
jgi:hypothetical protein